MEITIGMPLINDLSCNHYLGRRRDGGYYVKRHVADWKDELGWKLKPHHMEDWKLPLIVRCDIVQADKRTRDPSNFAKVCLDSIEDTTGINDVNMRWVDGSISYGEYAKLVITIKEG